MVRQVQGKQIVAALRFGHRKECVIVVNGYQIVAALRFGRR